MMMMEMEIVDVFGSSGMVQMVSVGDQIWPYCLILCPLTYLQL